MPTLRPGSAQAIAFLKASEKEAFSLATAASWRAALASYPAVLSAVSATKAAAVVTANAAKRAKKNKDIKEVPDLQAWDDQVRMYV